MRWWQYPMLLAAIPIGIYIAARDRIDAWRYRH